MTKDETEMSTYIFLFPLPPSTLLPHLADDIIFSVFAFVMVNMLLSLSSGSPRARLGAVCAHASIMDAHCSLENFKTIIKPTSTPSDHITTMHQDMTSVIKYSYKRSPLSLLLMSCVRLSQLFLSALHSFI